jgi:hypothetical protein
VLLLVTSRSIVRHTGLIEIRSGLCSIVRYSYYLILAILHIHAFTVLVRGAIANVLKILPTSKREQATFAFLLQARNEMRDKVDAVIVTTPNLILSFTYGILFKSGEGSHKFVLSPTIES